MQVSGEINIHNIKRCYANIVIIRACPTCNTACTVDMVQQYISYPEVGTKLNISFYCNQCDDHFEVAGEVSSAILTLTLDD